MSLIIEKFRDLDFAYAATAADSVHWCSDFARKMLEESLDESSQLGTLNVQEEEPLFWSAALDWILARKNEAQQKLSLLNTPSSKRLLNLITKPKILIIAQMPINFKTELHDSQIELITLGYENSKVENSPYSTLGSLCTRLAEADLFYCGSIEHHDIPLDIVRLHCPTIGYTSLQSRFLQSTAQWLFCFDHIVVPTSSDHKMLKTLTGRSVISMPGLSAAISSKCLSTTLRKLLLLSILDAPSRIDINADVLTQKEPSFYTEYNGPYKAVSGKRIFSLARAEDAFAKSTTPQRLLDAIRATMLDYARSQHPPAIRNMKIKIHERKHYEVAHQLCLLTSARFPNSLIARFNSCRFVFHYGEPVHVREAIAMALQILKTDPTSWCIDALDDVLPTDFFPLFFNYERYLNTIKAGLVKPPIQVPILITLIYASLNAYLSNYRDPLQHLNEACRLDSEWPFFRYRHAEELLRVGRDTEAQCIMQELSHGTDLTAKLARSYLNEIQDTAESRNQSMLDEEYLYLRLASPSQAIRYGGAACS